MLHRTRSQRNLKSFSLRLELVSINLFKHEKYLSYTYSICLPMMDVHCLQYVFQPSIYDSFIVIRQTSYFRDSLTINNPSQAMFMTVLPYHDSYLLALFHLTTSNYSYVYNSSLFSHMNNEIFDLNL